MAVAITVAVAVTVAAAVAVAVVVAVAVAVLVLVIIIVIVIVIIIIISIIIIIIIIIIIVPRLPLYCLNSDPCPLQYSSDGRTNQDSFFWVVRQQNLQGRNASCHTIRRKDLSRNQSNFRTFRRKNMCSQDPIKEEFIALFIKVTVPKEIKSNLRKQTYQISGIALACVRTHTFTVTRTVVQVVAVKPRTVFSSPTRITETYCTYAISIMEAAVWAVNDYQERITLFKYHCITLIKCWETLNTSYTPVSRKVVLQTRKNKLGNVESYYG